MRTFLLVTDGYLVGLAVVVGIVVYPAFSAVGINEWPSYHQRHSSAISVAVAPAWLLQGLLCAAWIVSGPERVLAFTHGLFALLGVLVTVLGAVPQHNAISAERTSSHLGRLQLWHWVRTVLWIGALVCASAL
ncbi:unannotated protein [freshwater metagenome]|uniref:Unannotated protein n=1 Tax=freshwater metagenome TaxID=449393 RepID=A0A6J7DQ30_9ZZZZ|nr:hypothetical protein [Actinomycetota bacterium]MUH58281.1 hypothetical protein [Actinomycetota bacterium]